MIRFREQLMEQLYQEAEKHYPRECCGILLGRIQTDGSRLAERLWPVANSEDEGRQQNHFLISPEALRKAEVEAGMNGCEIAGFYHSHPDCSAAASELDAAYAIPGLSYPIISVVGGRAMELRSWEKVREGEAERFREEWIMSPL